MVVDNTDKIHIIIDETSAMHLVNERYFIIDGYVTTDINLIKSRCRRIEKKLKDNFRYINNLVEIKGNKLKVEHSVQYVSYIKNNSQNFIPISILIDKDKLTKKQWNENEAFNFFVKWLVNYLIKFKIIDVSKYKNIEVHMDNRSINTQFRDSLETHLNLNFYKYNINFSVVRKDSKKYSEIRCADIVCYMLYRIYNHTKSKKTNILLTLLISEKINLIEYQSFFHMRIIKILLKRLIYCYRMIKLLYKI